MGARPPPPATEVSFEPLPRSTTAGHHRAATNMRWRAWYSCIGDEMLRDPKATIAEIAQRLKRHPGTVGAIVASDTFRDYFARRRKEFSELHDFSIAQGLTDVAEASLELLASRLRGSEAARVPTKQLTETAAMVLDRLGYAPSTSPATQVNINNNSGQQVLVPPTALPTLERARSALRASEAANAAAPVPQAAVTPTLSVPAPAPSEPSVPLVPEIEYIPPPKGGSANSLGNPPLLGGGGFGCDTPRASPQDLDDSSTPRISDL